MIGSTVNPALGRIDYSPIVQGAQAAAQSIQNAGQITGQMYSNLGGIGAQLFGTLAKQKQEEKQYQSIISSTKAFVSNVDQLKDVSPEIKDWVKKTSSTIDDPKLSSMEKAALAQTLAPMYNSVIGSAISQSMASDARKKQGMELHAALKRNQTAGIEEQLNTPGMTFEKLNVAAKASPQQTLSILSQYMPIGEAIAVMKNTDELDRKKTQAEIGLLEAQTTKFLTPAVAKVGDVQRAENDVFAAKEAELGRALTAAERVAARQAMQTPRATIVNGTVEEKVLVNPATGESKKVTAQYVGGQWLDKNSAMPLYNKAPGLFGGGEEVVNPAIFGGSTAAPATPTDSSTVPALVYNQKTKKLERVK